ncbi:MAG: tetratricopeptide repeat protein [Pseudanabaenaceae cyanobacterium]
MTQRTARQWIINGVLIVITLSFLGLSLAPVIGSIFNTPNQPQATNSPQSSSEQERLKIQIEGFEAVLKREPKNQTALVGLVNLRNQIGDIKGTLEPLQTLVEANPTQMEYRMALARTHLALSDRPAALAEYRKILATKPGYIQAIEAIVSLELQDNRPEAAIGLLQETLKTAETANKVQPNSVDRPIIQWILGELYRQQNRNEEAITVYDQMIKENSKNFRPYIGKAQVFRAQQKTEEARKLFDQAIELAPADYRDRVKSIANTPFTTPSSGKPASSGTEPNSTASPNANPGNNPSASPTPKQ